MPLFDTKENSFDPTLASLFASSAGPVAPPKKSRNAPKVTSSKKPLSHAADVAVSKPSYGGSSSSSAASSDSDSEDSSGSALDDSSDAESDHDNDGVSPTIHSDQETRKRKRTELDDNLEGEYLTKLAKEEEKEAAETKASRINGVNGTNGVGAAALEASDSEVPSVASGDEKGDDGYVPPVHESQAKEEDVSDFEKASRTVFLGNVSTAAIGSKTANKTLRQHLSSFLSELPASDPPHKIESLRFRSTAYSAKLPKKAAYVTKDLMDATTKSTNAYAVYTTKLAAREATRRLNATVVLDRHLRADLVAHPSKVDHRRCVFVGNLGFVDDDSHTRDASEDAKKKKAKKDPSDAEEGLWRQFNKAGTVESVRVVRDPKTRVGKGFAYVQFVDENAVEAALLFNDKKFPPLLPRKLRVMRAHSVKRKSAARSGANSIPSDSTSGRAPKLLGKAAAARMRNEQSGKPKRQKLEATTIKPPETFVFEGHRAKSRQGKSGLKLGTASKSRKASRSAKRAAAWKASNSK